MTQVLEDMGVCQRPDEDIMAGIFLTDLLVGSLLILLLDLPHVFDAAHAISGFASKAGWTPAIPVMHSFVGVFALLLEIVYARSAHEYDGLKVDSCNSPFTDFFASFWSFVTYV